MRVPPLRGRKIGGRIEHAAVPEEMAKVAAEPARGTRGPAWHGREADRRRACPVGPVRAPALPDGRLEGAPDPGRATGENAVAHPGSNTPGLRLCLTPDGGQAGSQPRVAAGRAACQRASRVLRFAPVLRMTSRPPLRSICSYGALRPRPDERVRPRNVVSTADPGRRGRASDPARVWPRFVGAEESSPPPAGEGGGPKGELRTPPNATAAAGTGGNRRGPGGPPAGAAR